MNSNIGYNLVEGGNSTLGYKFTKKQRLNVSRANKGKSKPNQSKTRLRLFKEGRLTTPCQGLTKKDRTIKELQKKRKKTMLRRYGSNFNGKIPWNKGLTKENCDKIKKAAKKGSKTQKENKKQVWNKGKKLSKEHRKNLSKSHMGNKRTKESIEKQIKTIKQKKQSLVV